MTQEEIIKGNKIIAEFMGAKMIVTDYYGINIIKFPDESTKDLFALKYHCSWDWLMPVVKKCLTVGDNSDMWDVLFNALSMVEIDSLFGAVVDFIKWYNENKE